ncbi:hypothetical protein phiA829_146 [Aeromonas phage phiA8-29]|uniref:Uncharacterized protein n=1 Tax=Aeromonas phage phiA8-29 TaxID=1978922 RepID=A0A1W6DYL5_9CAUD|nr:hypothetical protein HWB15_gp131 [Aeromonas phage phiA8-29]ARK07966.1 hypothetical protein phiA829_146 [Aeromonas phage phiA8-29]
MKKVIEEVLKKTAELWDLNVKDVYFQTDEA